MLDIQPEYTIGRAQPCDVPAIIEIDKAAGMLFGPTGLLSDDALRDHVPADVLLEASELGTLDVIRRTDKEPVGFALFTDRNEGLYLDQVSVHPRSGRQGLGTILMQHLDQRAAALSKAHITLSTFRDLAWNGPFYRSLGYRVMKRSDLEPYMLAIEDAQRPLMDVTKRVFMRKHIRRGLF